MMRASRVLCSGRAWRLSTQSVAAARRSGFAHAITSSSPSARSSYRTPVWSSASRVSARRTAATPPPRGFPLAWLLWPRWASRRVAVLRAAVVRRVPVPSAVLRTFIRGHRHLEAFLAMVERPARVGVTGGLTLLRIALQLGISVLQLCQEVYLYVFSPRLRRFLRFALGVPFLVGTLFLLEMRNWYFPEVGTGLDTSCVAALPLCHTVEEAMATAAHLQQRYRRLQAQRRRGEKKVVAAAAAAAAAEDVEGTSPVVQQPRVTSLLQPLTPAEENELLGAIFVLLRSIETQIVGTAEERALITPRADVVTAVTPPQACAPAPAAATTVEVAPMPSTANPAAVVASTMDQEDTVTATPHIAETPAAAAAAATAAATAAIGATAASPLLVSPAEYILRVVMAISIAEGWADITEHTRVLFQELVRNKTPPVQSRIVQAVGELCSLSYELESGQVDAITLDQRKRIATAIDAFRPERSVEERCTIAHEITILPLPDFDHTTRCLGMIRKSPGRKPQLILCFVGSNSKRNWLTNFNYWPVPLPERYGVVGAPLPGNPGRVAHPQVHRGFLGLVQTVPYKDVAADFDHILLVGHSLGGALAQLAGLELAAERPSRRITVITMASPRVLAVDWRTRLWEAGRQAWAHRTGSVVEAPHKLATPATASAAPVNPADAHERDTLAEMLATPVNFRHFRGYLQPDVVPHLPPEFLHFTHSGQRIPLNTGCATSLSFMAWGMYSELYHSSDLYKSVLRHPIVSQTHWFKGEDKEDEIDVEEYVQMPV